MEKKQVELLQNIIKKMNEIQVNTYYKNYDFFKSYNYLKHFYNEDNENEEINKNDFEKVDEKLDECYKIINSFDNEYYKLIFELNNLLNYKDKNKEVLKLEEKMKEIQVKKYITVDEFEKMFNISKSSQRDYRSRLKNPLPYHQKIEKGKIVYVVSEVEKWFSNQYK